jgi:hypothetical protein
MAGHWTEKFSFVTGAVRSKVFAYVVLSDDELNEMKYPHSGFVVWDAGKWGDGGRTNWWLAGVSVSRRPRVQMCAVGTQGGVLLLGSGDRHEEQIAPEGQAPRDRGPLRGVRTIGERVYVVGMNRQAYRRDGDSAWVSIDQGARPQPGSGQVVGFEAVDGFAEDEIYAVGWEGEIWRYDARIWTAIASPTNVVLTNLCCGGDGMAYASGRNGLLLRGRDNRWEVIEQQNIIDDIWGLAWYGGQLYLATTNALYTLEGDTLNLVDLGDDPPKTCYHLSAADGVLWSIGPKDVMAFDGATWVRID